MIPLLDASLLDSYEERLRSRGLPIDAWVRPGLSSEEIEDILSPLGLELPREAMVWWKWHDGARYGEGRERLFGPGKSILPLTESVETYKEFRVITTDLVDPDVPLLSDPENRWKRTWLPIIGRQLPTVIDCGVGLDAPTPIRFIDLQNVVGSPVPRAQSLGQMVEWWIRAIDCGAWSWNPDRGRWDTHGDLYEEEFKNSVLV